MLLFKISMLPMNRCSLFVVFSALSFSFYICFYSGIGRVRYAVARGTGGGVRAAQGPHGNTHQYEESRSDKFTRWISLFTCLIVDQ